MGERWLEVCLGKAQFFGETQEQHYSSGMNRPEGFRTLLQLQKIHRLKNLRPHLDLELLKFRDAESIVIASPVPANEIDCVPSLGSQLSELYGAIPRFVRNPDACAAVAESADALPIGASCTFRVNKSRTWLRDDDQDIPKFG